MSETFQKLTPTTTSVNNHTYCKLVLIFSNLEVV